VFIRRADGRAAIKPHVVCKNDIYFHHNIETEDFDKVNDIFQYMQASCDNSSTIDEESAVEDDNNPLEIFWLIFSNSQNTKTLPLQVAPLHSLSSRDANCHADHYMPV
jgi:hypothetical protein